MAHEKEKRKKVLIIGVSCLVFICLLVSAITVLKFLMKDDGRKRKRRIQQVTMLKPPPPPKIKEKPPEPEIKKKEEVIEEQPEEQPEDDLDNSMDEDIPPGEELGLDSDGTGGMDGFGLKAKKGGRSLIAGSGGEKTLLRRYAWYTKMLSDEIREKVNKYLEDKENIPSGKHRMLLRVGLDLSGNMQLYAIAKSSGNLEVDKAVEEAIVGFKVSEVPPEEMPKILKVRVIFKS